jgi:hypothetical protein
MADVSGKFFSTVKVRTGVSPSSPGVEVGETLPPVNPPGGGLNSVGLTMPPAFAVANSPLTSNGTLEVTGAGTVAQYVRGDGSLADFPSTTGGGSSVSYYLNGSVNQGTFGGVSYYEVNRTPVLGAGTDFTINADGYIASFITDAMDPNQLVIPSGNWNFETYFQASSGGGSPTFYVELYKVSGTTFTLIASSSGSPELIAFGTNLTPYFSTLAVPQTTLALTDRLAIRYYVTHSGRTITLHTENNTLCQIITTFTTGLTALNGLTNQVQFFAVGTSGTDFNIASATDTHTFNLPTASSTNRGALSSADWTTFNNKENAITAGTTAQYFRGDKTFQTLNTSVVPEGTNLYYTEARVNANTNVAANTAARHNAVTLGTANGLSLSTQVLSLGLASAGVTGAISGTDWSTFNSKQNALTLTTTGTSGVATLVGSTLNIPNYGGALSGYLPLTGGTLTGPLGGTSAAFTGDIRSNGIYRDYQNEALIQTNTSGVTEIGTSGAANGRSLSFFAGNISRLTIASTGASTFSGNTTGAIATFINTNTAGTGNGILVDVNSQSGTDNYVMNLISNGTSRMYVREDGNVGIGTLASAARLTISANSGVDVLNVAGYDLLKWDGGDILTFGGYKSGQWNSLVFSTTGSPRLTIASTGAATFSSSVTAGGNIELTNGANRQIIIGSATNYNYRLRTDNDDFVITEAGVTDRLRYSYSNVRWTFSAPSTFTNSITVGGGSLFNANSGTLTQDILTVRGGGSSGNFGFRVEANNGEDIFFVNNTSYNIIMSPIAGNVLIGTTDNAGFKLDVNGTGRFSGNLEVVKSSNPYLIINDSGVASTGGILFQPTGFNAKGGLTLNFATAEQRLFTGEGGNTYFQTFYTNGVERMRITSGGNVGIGTASPTDFGSTYNVLSINGSSGGGILDLMIGGTRSLTLGVDGGEPSISSRISGNPIVFRTNNGGTVATRLTIASTGAATFSSSVTASGGSLFNANSGTLTADVLTVRGGGASGNFGFRVEANNGDDLLFVNALTYNVTINSLAGSGNRIVVANSGGTLISAVIGSGLAFDGTTLTATGGGSGSISGSGTSGTVALFTGATSIGNSVITQSSSSVLISTTTNPYGVASLVVNHNSTLSRTYFQRGVELIEIQPSDGSGPNIISSSYSPSGSAYKPLGLSARQNSADLYLTTGGRVLIGTTSDNGNLLRVNGTIFSDSSVTATSFFESSDATLKTLVKDDYQAKGIDSVVAKLYIKNGKQELGYFAQDLQGILPSAVSKGSDGLLNLSYREVHTAKIASLEKRITELESQLKNN